MMAVKSVASADYSFLNKLSSEIEEEFRQIPLREVLNPLRPTPEDREAFSAGLSPENSHKNRYPDILADERTRVKLEERKNDYINANDCLTGRIIISQGPLPGEDHHADFYHMLWTNGCEAVAMLTDYEEKCRPKCSCYLPDEGVTKTIGEYTVTTLSDESVQEDVLWKLGVKITKVVMGRSGKEPRILTHYHYPHWADNEGTSGKVVAALTWALQDKNKPVLHCSAGIGRAGTLAASMRAYEIIESGEVSETLIPDAVKSVREERRGCVQTFPQYRTVYEAVKILVEKDVIEKRTQKSPKID